MNIFSETAGPIKAKFYMEPPWVRGMKVCSGDMGHMTKMAAMPIYRKNPLKVLFSGTKVPMTLGLNMQHQVLGPNKVCSNGDLDFFMARSNLLSHAFIWENIHVFRKNVTTNDQIDKIFLLT